LKYCTRCGVQNEDQAVFCTACGQRFPDQAAPVGQHAGAAAAAQPFPLFTAEMGPGAHEHMFTDVFLKDTSGKVLLVAKRQSLLHRNYTIVDGGGAVAGFIEAKSHLTHTSLNIEGPSHDALGAVQESSIERKGSPADCWLEDASGNRQASIVFTNGVFSFSVVRADGSRVFDATLSAGAGVRQTLGALERRSYAIVLLEPSFPLPTLVTIIAAVDHA